jgi:hypothetical protein
MTAPERFADSQIPLAPRAPSIHDPTQTCRLVLEKSGPSRAEPRTELPRRLRNPSVVRTKGRNVGRATAPAGGYNPNQNGRAAANGKNWATGVAIASAARGALAHGVLVGQHKHIVLIARNFESCHSSGAVALATVLRSVADDN